MIDMFFIGIAVILAICVISEVYKGIKNDGISDVPIRIVKLFLLLIGICLVAHTHGIISAVK